jgi:AbrB family looped-hinge helix DNA binding protein
LTSGGGTIDKNTFWMYNKYEKCENHIYMEVSIMSLPKGKHIFGTVKVGERGQIVIPKEARELFNIKPGDTLLVLGDEKKGIAISKADVMKEIALKILGGFKSDKSEREDNE